MNDEAIKTVTKLNANLADDSEFAFSYETNEFWDAINFCIFSTSIPIWNSENDERDYVGDEKESLYPFVLGVIQNRVIELMKATGLTKLLKGSLDHIFTDFTMLDEGSWEPDEDSIRQSLENIEELEDIFQFDLEDTRKNEK